MFIFGDVTFTSDNIMTFITTCITPLLISYLAYVTTKKEKESKRLDEKKDSIIQERDALLKKNEEKTEKKISELEDMMKEIKLHLETTDKFLNEKFIKIENNMNVSIINNKIEKIMSLIEITMKYIMAIDNLVIVIGKSVDTIDYNNIHDPLQQYNRLRQEFISEITALIYQQKGGDV